MLKVNADTQGKDYLDYIVPFVCYVLEKNRPKRISDSSTQDFLKQEFGLTLPVQAVGLVLRRLARRRILKRESNGFVIAGPIPIGKIDERRSAARRQQKVLSSHLRQFVEGNYQLTWSEADAITAFVQYLSHFSVECLRTFASGKALPAVPIGRGRNLFIVGAFIAYCYDAEPAVFECIVVFVKGNMLANALLCSDLDALERKFTGVTFYIDTPLFMWLARLWGAHRYAAASELLEQLRTLNARVAIFDHTVAEIQHVLQSCESNIDNPKASAWRMIAAMRDAGITKTDVTFLRGSLSRELASLGIIQEDDPPYRKEFQIDESYLQNALDEDIRYMNPKALEDDVNSIRCIYALRRGKRPLHLEDAIAVFVTTNARLAEAANKFGQEQEASREVSPVITEFSLANIAWLKAPLRAPELPMFELMAECYAVMEPRHSLWTKYLDEIQRLAEKGRITADEHEVLRSSVVAREELMNLTLGAEEDLTERTLSQVVERVKADLAKEKDIEITNEQMRHAVTESKRLALLQQASATRRRILATAERIGRYCTRAVIGGLIAVLLAIALLGAFGITTIGGTWIVNIPLSIVIVFGAVWSVLSGFSRFSFDEIAKFTHRYVERRVTALLFGWLGLAAINELPVEADITGALVESDRGEESLDAAGTLKVTSR
jgi:hypothetical protein